MPRSLSAVVKQAMLAQQTGASFWVLLELSHATFTAPLRFCTNNEVVTRLGLDWLPAVFDVTLPEESAEQLPRSTLSVENIDRTILDALRFIQSPIDVAIYVATSADVDLVIGPFNFVWRDSQYDATSIQASLESEDLLNQRWPKDEFVPSKFPGLFR